MLSYDLILHEELTLVVLLDRLVLVDLDLDTALWHEFGDLHSLHGLAENCWVSFALQTIVERVQIGCCDEVFKVQWLYVSMSCETSSGVSLHRQC